MHDSAHILAADLIAALGDAAPEQVSRRFSDALDDYDLPSAKFWSDVGALVDDLLSR